MEKQKIAIIGLGVAIILIVQYFLISDLVNQKNEESMTIFQNGYDAGVESTIKLLFAKTDNCQPADIFMNETTRILVDYDCVKPNP
jgi:hypothetical protein